MSNVFESAKDEYLISTDKQKIDVDMVHDYLSNESYWSKNIPKEVVIRAIENSMCFCIYKNDRQIGFSRIVTDKATFAYLADVFIIDAERGKGLSKWLMKVIHDHPELQGLRRWLLGTRDAHKLYEQFGWTLLPEAQVGRFMQKHDPEVYQRNITT
ncbi:MAG: family N-acetyltransferase [Chitinophagaceae bacterium]|nr:family N-acetyltransferase [Chitinophagaceae bacterium]